MAPVSEKLLAQLGDRKHTLVHPPPHTHTHTHTPSTKLSPDWLGKWVK